MSHTFPSISLVTPSFNQAEFLEAAIQSVLSQQYPNLEYIIIDGGSTDGSLEIIKRYEKHLSFWSSEPDAGQYDAINKGFARSTGDLMAWLNSDDMYFPWTLKTVASIMSELPNVEWLTTLAPCFWDWSGFCTGFRGVFGYSKDAFLDGRYLPWHKNAIGWIQQESTFWRRSLWEKAGGRVSTEFQFASDFELWTRFYDYAELHGTPSPLGGFRSQHSQRIRQKNRYLNEAQQILGNMRRRTKWSPSMMRQTIFLLRLYKFPILRRIFLPKICYYGKELIRANADTPQGLWRVKEYSFY